MKRTFQKWLLVFVSVAFVLTFLIFFFVQTFSSRKQAETTINQTLINTQESIKTNDDSLNTMLHWSKEEGLSTAEYAKSRTSLNYANYVMKRLDAIEFSRLYYKVATKEHFPDVQDLANIIDYDEDGNVSIPENFSSLMSSSLTSQEIVQFNLCFANVKTIMERLYDDLIIYERVPIDSLHLIDPGQNTSLDPTVASPTNGGWIIGSTTCGYFGYDMYSRTFSPGEEGYQEQSNEFIKGIYDSSTLDFAQDIRLDSSNNYWQYAGVREESSSLVGVVQIGTKAEEIQKRMELLNPKVILSPIGVANTGYMMMLQKDKDNRYKIIGYSDNLDKDQSLYIGQYASDYGLSDKYFSSSPRLGEFNNIFHKRCMVNFVSSHHISLQMDYALAAVLPLDEVYASRNINSFYLAVGTAFLFLVIFILISNLVQKVVIKGIHRVNRSLDKITRGNLNERINEFSSREFVELSTGINKTVDALKDAIKAEKTRIDKDLALAKAIQLSALPSLFPPYPERKEFDIYATMTTAKEVGGDFYDFFFIDGNRFVFLIADVSGKGIPAALFMMTVKTLIKNYAETRLLSPAEIFNKVNKELCEHNEAEMFVTAFMCMCDVRDGKIIYVNAGHNQPLIKKGNKFAYLKTKPGFVLGGISDYKYQEEIIQLSYKDKLYLYTDGVTEATNKKLELYGENRLEEYLNKNCINKNSERVLKDIQENVFEFMEGTEQADDITQLCFEYLRKN